jgi:hypothetical protein
LLLSFFNKKIYILPNNFEVKKNNYQTIFFFEKLLYLLLAFR